MKRLAAPGLSWSSPPRIAASRTPPARRPPGRPQRSHSWASRRADGLGGEGRRSDGMQQIFMLGSPNSVVTLRVGVFKPDLFLLSKKHTLDGW